MMNYLLVFLLLFVFVGILIVSSYAMFFGSLCSFKFIGGGVVMCMLYGMSFGFDLCVF